MEEPKPRAKPGPKPKPPKPKSELALKFEEGQRRKAAEAGLTLEEYRSQIASKRYIAAAARDAQVAEAMGITVAQYRAERRKAGANPQPFCFVGPDHLPYAQPKTELTVQAVADDSDLARLNRMLTRYQR